MSEQKRYAAQEMRELSNRIWDYEKMSSGLELTINAEDYVDCEATQNLIAMLRQAADAEEELAKYKSAYMELMTDSAKLIVENAQLKARLEAVVKECEKINEEKFRMNEVLAAKVILNRILRAARGESENENK